MNTEVIKQFAKSDDLVRLRTFFAQDITFLSTITPILQLEIIVDANVVIGDLIWLVKRRKISGARTKLQELIDSETVIAHAPFVLANEVERHLPDVANKHGIEVNELEAEWRQYATKIKFYEVELEDCIAEGASRDPNDRPYISLQKLTGAPIYTKDKDIPAMGGATVGFQVVAQLRDYSRSAAVEYSIKRQGIVVAVLSGEVVEQVFKLMKSLTNAVSKLPPWLRLLAGASILIALLHPRVRRMVSSWLSSLPIKAKKIGNEIFRLTEPLVLEHERAKRESNATLESVTKKLKEINV